MNDPLLELHALAVLDVLETAQQTVDEWYEHRTGLGPVIARLEDALTRLDRVEVVKAAA